MLNSPIEEIKNRLDVVDIIGGYLKLQKTGANYRAVCPFHSEKKPSFFVSPSRQIWHCFGCGKGGDIFRFVMEVENIEFGDALKILAQKAGIELRPQDQKLKTERQRLLEICDLSSKFFKKQLHASQKGEEAKKYLLGRGIFEDSIEDWQIGYAPNTWTGLTDFLKERGYREEEIVKAGLATENQKSNIKNQNCYDRFRGRIMFPIFDLNSQVVGFGGRIFEETPDEIAKYVNTPSTPLYDKSRILYGLDRAKMEIRKEDRCILVEGYTDTIMSHQAGVKNVVSTSGTALTSYQLKILKRYTENLLTCFDMDVAGDSATKRGINLAQLQGFNIKVVTLMQDFDPADFISKEGKDAWLEKINEAKSFLEFYFESTFSKFSALGGDSLSPDGKREISKILLPVIKRIPLNIEQSHWVAELSYRLKVPENKVWEDLNKISLNEEERSFEEEISSSPIFLKKSRRDILEEQTLRLLFRVPQNIALVNDSPFKTTLASQVFNNLKREGANFKIDNFQKDSSPEACQFVNNLLLKNECEQNFKDLDHSQEFKLCLAEMKKIDLREKLIDLELDIKIQEKEGKDISQLMEEFDKTSQELANLESC